MGTYSRMSRAKIKKINSGYSMLVINFCILWWLLKEPFVCEVGQFTCCLYIW